MNCGLCDKTDGMCYTSQPPQVKCTVTGEFHLFSDKCNVIELFQQVKAERDAAVRDLHGNCKVCAKMFPCAECLQNPISEIERRDDNWIWRGPQQEET